MTKPSSIADEANKLRTIIGDFLQERLQTKLDSAKKDDDEARQKLEQDFRPEAWIADAARRVRQIQQVTHAIKFTHPDAKGTSLHAPGNDQASELTVGTHTVAHGIISDVVGNAAALDVNKFLRLEVDGKSVLTRASEGDLALEAAFSSDSALAQSWMNAFSEITMRKSDTSSHTLAKQVYWPLGNNEYHLLAPLFPTSLIHTIWTTIRNDRFSDPSREARTAQKNGLTHPHGYREYPNVAVQKFGGTKPQNISQLNSERYGENYLLPSLPPRWRSDPVRAPLRISSIFEGWFERRTEVRNLVRILRDYLTSVHSVNNIHIRNKRAELVAYIRDELMYFASELYELDAGWSQQKDCQLNIDEQCWLDPKRAQFDDEFARIRTREDWQDGVCRRFANWLNGCLIDSPTPLPMGDPEAQEWHSVLETELRMMRLEVNTHD